MSLPPPLSSPAAAPAARPRVLVIVGGSVAAIKAPPTLRRLREQGAETMVIATPAALKFITELSLSVAAAREVGTDERWFSPQPDALHLTHAKVDAAVVVGATAELIAGAAGGHAGDLALATLLSVRGPVLWVPAMNEAMWLSRPVQENVARLRAWGHEFLGPEVGAFGTRHEGRGVGRLAEPETIAAAVLERLSPARRDLEEPRDLEGLRVVVSAGPTREYLDPVRFISNPSSGKMGYAVAQAARRRGAQVVLVSGPVSLPDPEGVEVVRIESALELREAVRGAAQDADIVVMTAAVADYRAAHPAGEKQAKVAGDVTLTLTPNPDILAELGAANREGGGRRVLVGFAMETHAGVERAAAKAARKGADFILLNYPTQEGTAFGGDDNEVTLVRADGQHEAWPRTSKREVAERLLTEARRIWAARAEA